MLQSATELVEQFLVIAALVSVLWAAVSFIRAQSEQRERMREQRLANWRKATVQQLLHRSEKFMSLAAITSELRSSSFDTDLEIKKAELNESEVRLLLLDMLEASVISQLWGDCYGISHFDFAAEVQERNAMSIRVTRRAFDHMYDAPGAFTTEKLYTKVLSDLNIRMPTSEFHMMIHELVRQDVASQDARGRWYPKGTSVEAPLYAQGNLLDASPASP